ncbi:MAG: SPOR domain-containing protein [Burkholderiales bacterium]|nr:SPOR domain-containing protein [Burkholderiales bacterium]MDE2076640.1 SPOR domain-containing protein [Burkholderiales bacterium]MDE2434148.1 SPOR domain-containing protein [Burkholderiales bacterium]
MSQPSFFKRLFQGGSSQRPGAEPVSVSQADVEAIRIRARRRLIGMAVLVGAGVIGFPWLFETKPRPMASDIEVVQQGASSPTAALTRPGVQAQVKSVSAPKPDAAESKEEFVKDAPKAASEADKRPVSRVASAKPDEPKDKPADKKVDKDKDAKPTTKPVVTKAVPAPANKPQATAPDKDKAASAAADRYVVQIGAYTDVPSAHEVRMKAEKAGLKTYTQVIGADASKKIRVRVGPFEDKAAAEKAMMTLRKAGLPGALLTL